MTPKKQRPTPDTTALRFLLEQFIDVPEGDGDTTGLARLQVHAARAFLPGSQRGAPHLQQQALLALTPAAFQQLRRDVRDWLRSLVMFSHVGHQRVLKGPLTLSLISAQGKPDRLRAPIVEGPAADVFWFYLLHLLSRAGLTRIRVCRAPKSQRDPGLQNPELGGKTEPCGRLFLRRGQVKKYCSERCRARVATQNARKDKGAR